MKSTMTLFAILTLMLFQSSCDKKDKEVDDPAGLQKGYVKGKVVDPKGRPMAGVEVVIDNTLLYNSNLVTKTKADGTYSVKLYNTTWSASATHKVDFDGKTYLLPLDPDDASEFSQEGAIRNFQWKLTGRDSETGLRYGGFIYVNKEITSSLWDSENIEFTLTPVGTIIDGTQGQVLKMKHGALGSGDAYKLVDIPIGKYRVTATHPTRTIKLRNSADPSSTFATSTVISFDPLTQLGPNSAEIEFTDK